MRNPIRLIPGWTAACSSSRSRSSIGLGALGGRIRLRAVEPAGRRACSLPVVPNLDVPPPSGLLVDISRSGRPPRPLSHEARRSRLRRHRGRGRIDRRGRSHAPARTSRAGSRMASRSRSRSRAAPPGSVVITRTNLNTATLEELEVVPGFTERICPGGDRLPDQLRRVPEHPRAGRGPRHERGRVTSSRGATSRCEQGPARRRPPHARRDRCRRVVGRHRRGCRPAAVDIPASEWSRWRSSCRRLASPSLFDLR